MSSSNARMIGDAPTIWTALRWDSMRLMALSSDPAQTKSIRSTRGHVDRHDRRRCANSAMLASCAFVEPASTPLNTRGSASPSSTMRDLSSSECVGRHRVAGHRRGPGIGGGSHDGGDCSNAIAYSMERSSKAS